MAIELDHVFVCGDVGAPEAESLVRAGLTEGSRNTHSGQGTANRRFFFANAFLELLWVRDPVEAQSEMVLSTQLWERWSQRGAGPCPFGLVLRPGADDTAPPFETWSYRPPYLPADLSIDVACGIAPTEPLVFYLPFARDRGAAPNEPLEHPAGIARWQSVELSLPEHAPSPAIQALVAAGVLTLRAAHDYLLTIRHQGPGTSALDLRPELPLRFVRA